MKKLYFLTLLMLLAGFLHGQNWEWSNQLESASAVTSTDIVIDNDDNVYLIGTYEASDMTVQGLTIPNAGDIDGYVCKFSPDGNVQWLNGIGGNDREFAISSVLVGNSIFVIGDFRSSAVYFTPTDSLEQTDNFDAFLAEYDLDGNFISATSIFYGTDIQRIKGMYYNSTEGVLLIIGQFKDEFRYQDGVGEIVVNPRGPVGKDHFVVKSNLAGEILDTLFFQTTHNKTILKDINPATNQGYYVVGDVHDWIQFSDPANTINGNAAATADPFVVRIDNNLDFEWARKGGGLNYDHVNNSVSDRYGNVYLTGKVEGDVVFDSTATITTGTISGFGAQDIYLAKYNKTGVLQWIRRKGDAGNDDGFGLIQNENLVQFCGNISGEVIFNIDTLRSSGTGDINTGFAIFDLAGNEIGAQGIGGLGTDRGEAINFNNLGNTIIAGIFDSPNLDIGDSAYVNASGTNDGFIAEYYYPMNAVFTQVTNIDCYGEASGRLIVTPYFGVGPYTYNWSGNVATFTDSLAYDLAADNYSVTITDSRAISASTSIDLSQPAALEINKTLQDVSCHPENGTSNDGAIDLTVSGGTAMFSYSYSWETISGSGVNASAEDQASLATGEYSVTVTDDNMCSARDTSIIGQPDVISFSGSIVTPATGGGNDGAINANVSGGNEALPYDYLWSGGEVTEDILNLTGGNYSLSVTDNLGCIQDTTYLVEDLTLLLAYISGKQNVDCNGNSTGTATVGISGGTGPYNYSWENSVGTSIPGNQSIIDVPRGTYYVTVTDQFDARTAETSVQITEPAQALSALLVGSDLECYQDNTGIIDLTTSGGTLPYSFLWSNGATSEDLVNLPASTYEVTVTDNNGCQVIENTTIEQPPAIGMNVVESNSILCFGELSGELTATASGGSGTFTYQWNDPASQNTQTATGLEAGDYSVIATDIAGCWVSANFELSEPAQLTLSEVHQDVSCFGAGDGLINLTVAGGTPVFNYSWSNGAISQDISDLNAGIYSVTVTDANICEDELEVEIIEPTQVLIANIDIVDATCQGYSDGEISITGQGGIGIRQFSIDAGFSFTSDSVFLDLEAGTYSALVRDENGCQSVASEAIVQEPEGTVISAEESDDISCYGESDGTITITATNSSGDLEYSIDEGANYLDNGGIFDNLPEGTYLVWIRDINACVTQSSALEIAEPEQLLIDTTITHAEGSGTGAILVSSTGGTAPVTYYLVSGGESNSTEDGDFQDLLPGTYTVYANDVNLCESDTLNPTIRQSGSSAIVIYNSFSPNNDGVNDTWIIQNIEQFPTCKVTIFNTWGNEVFSSEGYTEPWDGNYNGSELPAWTYYYVIDLDDGSGEITGPVSIVR